MGRKTSDVCFSSQKILSQETASIAFEHQVLLGWWTLESRGTLLWRQCMANPPDHISTPNLATRALKLATTAKQLLKLIRILDFDVSMVPDLLQTFALAGSCVSIRNSGHHYHYKYVKNRV